MMQKFNVLECKNEPSWILLKISVRIVGGGIKDMYRMRTKIEGSKLVWMNI